MGNSLIDYLERMETPYLQTILENISRPEKQDEYDYVIPLIKEMLKKRTNDNHP